MTNKEFESLIKKNCDITPSESHREATVKAMRDEMAATAVERMRKKTKAPIWKRLAPIAACFVFIFAALGGFLFMRGENYQTVYIDVNPSVALSVNRFGKVNEVEYINGDAREALKGVELDGKKTADALESIIQAYGESGYFEEEAELYISASGKKTDKLLEKLEKRAEEVKGDKKYNVNTCKVTEEDRVLARELGISPGKYKVIRDVISDNPELEAENLKDLSMKELKELLSDDGGKNNGNGKDKDKDKNNKK